MYEIVDPKWSSRPVRVVFPARVCFSSRDFTIKEFTTDLSTGGIFLPTTEVAEPGTRGTLTFRISQWEEPFTVLAEVVRCVPPLAEDGSPECGLGIRFLDLSEKDRAKLQRLVNCIRDGSVVAAIRRTIREEKRSLDFELRRRPTDQKVMLAVGATAEEINTLIRDGNQAAIARLLKNPRLTLAQVHTILKDRRTKAAFLIALKKYRQWMVNEEVRFLYSVHPNAVLGDAVAQVKTLPVHHLRKLEHNTSLRPQVRSAAQDILKRKARGLGVCS